MNLNIREMTEKDNAAVADLVRINLKAAGLDIPGMVYFETPRSQAQGAQTDWLSFMYTAALSKPKP